MSYIEHPEFVVGFKKGWLGFAVSQVRIVRGTVGTHTKSGSHTHSI
jgi:hypothetical protein